MEHFVEQLACMTRALNDGTIDINDLQTAMYLNANRTVIPYEKGQMQEQFQC